MLNNAANLCETLRFYFFIFFFGKSENTKKEFSVNKNIKSQLKFNDYYISYRKITTITSKVNLLMQS